MTAHDAVVIGSGPNGLTAANLLAEAGWDVLVLESQPTAGGAVRSDRGVHPDFVHDRYSAFYPLAAASPVIKAMQLERHGLEWAHAPAVTGTPFPDGTWGVQHGDRNATAAALDGFHAGDGEAYLELVRRWDRIGDGMVDALMSPFPPVRAGARAAAALPRSGGLDFVRTMLLPLRRLVDERFGSRQADMLFAGNAVHADIPMDAPGSGAFAMILVMLGQTVGFPVARGGSSNLSDALEQRLSRLGGRIRTDCRVEEVLVRRRRAVGVRTQDGEVVEVRRAVVADVPAPTLYGGLVAPEHLPNRVLRRIERFEWDPATVKVDWALNGPVPWAAPPPVDPGSVHVADSVDEIAEAQSQLANGLVPARPFLVAGQLATADPSRAPAGSEALWCYTHLPQRFRGDAGDGAVTGAWDSSDLERIADRVQARFERLAPGFGSRVIARRVLGPHELEASDENLVNGALNGGTASLHQQLVFRPVPGLGRAETPVAGLFLASASAHPGGGVHGACGANAARAARAQGRLRRLSL